MLFKNIITGVSLVMLLNACSKRDVNPGNPSTIQTFNALNDGTNLFITFSHERPQVFRTLRLLNNKTFTVTTSRFYINSSSTPVQLFSRLDTLAKDGPVLNYDLELEKGSVYSMFMYGSKTDAKYALHKDIIPPLGMQDSTTHIRFANFSEDQEISVNLKGQPAGSFIGQIQQKSWSEFSKLPVNTVAKYEFEIRDLSTGNLITSYLADKVNDFSVNNGANLWYNKSNTVILVGKEGGTGTFLPRTILMPHR